MIVALKLPSGLQLGAHRLLGNHWHPGMPKPPYIVGGYGLTRGVAPEAWHTWLASNRTSALVVNHLIHATETEAEMKTWIAQHHESLSGMEPGFATAN